MSTTTENSTNRKGARSKPPQTTATVSTETHGKRKVRERGRAGVAVRWTGVRGGEVEAAGGRVVGLQGKKTKGGRGRGRRRTRWRTLHEAPENKGRKAPGASAVH